MWDLESWADHAHVLQAELARSRPQLEAGRTTVLRDGFVTAAAVLRHLQGDPLLPPPLVPQGWPGPELRNDYERYDAAFRSVWRNWLQAQAATRP